MPHARMEGRHIAEMAPAGANIYYPQQYPMNNQFVQDGNYGSLPSHSRISLVPYDDDGNMYGSLPSHDNVILNEMQNSPKQIPFPNYDDGFNSLPRQMSGGMSMPYQPVTYGSLPRSQDFQSHTLPMPNRDQQNIRQLPAPSLSRHTVKVLQVPFLVVGDQGNTSRYFNAIPANASPSSSPSSSISDPTDPPPSVISHSLPPQSAPVPIVHPQHSVSVQPQTHFQHQQSAQPQQMPPQLPHPPASTSQKHAGAPSSVQVHHYSRANPPASNRNESPLMMESGHPPASTSQVHAGVPSSVQVHHYSRANPPASNRNESPLMMMEPGHPPASTSQVHIGAPSTGQVHHYQRANPQTMNRNDSPLMMMADHQTQSFPTGPKGPHQTRVVHGSHNRSSPQHLEHSNASVMPFPSAVPSNVRESIHRASPKHSPSHSPLTIPAPVPSQPSVQNPSPSPSPTPSMSSVHQSPQHHLPPRSAPSPVPSTHSTMTDTSGPFPAHPPPAYHSLPRTNKQIQKQQPIHNQSRVVQSSALKPNGHSNTLPAKIYHQEQVPQQFTPQAQTQTQAHMPLVPENQQPVPGGNNDLSSKMREIQEEMQRVQMQMENQFRNMQLGVPTSMGPPTAGSFPPAPTFPEFPPLLPPPSQSPFGTLSTQMDTPSLHSQSMNSISTPSLADSNFGTMRSSDMGIGGPVIEEDSEQKGGKKQLKLNLDMHEFAPGEVKVKSDKNKLEVTAHHQEKDPNRVSCRVFHQQYHLPPNVRMAKMKYDMTPTGELKVEGTVKPRHRVKWAEDTLERN